MMATKESSPVTPGKQPGPKPEDENRRGNSRRIPPWITIGGMVAVVGLLLTALLYANEQRMQRLESEQNARLQAFDEQQERLDERLSTLNARVASLKQLVATTETKLLNVFQARSDVIADRQDRIADVVRDIHAVIDDFAKDEPTAPALSNDLQATYTKYLDDAATMVVSYQGLHLRTNEILTNLQLLLDAR